MPVIEEEWAHIDGLPNYEVSSYGRVGNAQRRNELKPSPDANGYLRVALYNAGVRHDVLLHRLVAKSFFLHYKEGVEVKLISDDKDDCSVANIELGKKRCRKK